MFALRRTFTSMAAQPRMAQALVATPYASFSNMEDKRKGEEKSYFSKQDAKLLKALVDKMEKRDDQDSQAEAEHDCLVDDLADIFGRHGLDKDGKNGLLWQELMEWKRHKY